jgi:hypothetical protein
MAELRTDSEEKLVERLRAGIPTHQVGASSLIGTPDFPATAALLSEAADTIASLVAERDALEGISHQLDDELSACKEEVERLREALTNARAYVLQAVNDDGGIDNCEIGDRLALERIDAVLQGAKP